MSRKSIEDNPLFEEEQPTPKPKRTLKPKQNTEQASPVTKQVDRFSRLKKSSISSTSQTEQSTQISDHPNESTQSPTPESKSSSDLFPEEQSSRFTSRVEQNTEEQVQADLEFRSALLNLMPILSDMTKDEYRDLLMPRRDHERRASMGWTLS